MARVVRFESPRLSTTVSATPKLPFLAYPCDAWTPLPRDPSPKSHENEAIVPSGSVEADPSNVTLTPMKIVPGENWKAARGGALTVTWWVAFDERLWLSTTVRIAVYTPGFAYACVSMTPLPAVESPNSQVYETIVPSGSNDADALNVTGEPGFVGDGLATKSATGGRGPGGGGRTTTS